MTPDSPGRPAAPSEAQRAFVLAALTVGLPLETIWHGMPHDAAAGPLPSPARLEQLFAAEINGAPKLAIRLIVARILERALRSDDADGLAAQMAVFRAIKDWQVLAQEATEDNFDPARLTRQERQQLRRLLTKAQAG